jgi:hypothetical protein
VIAADRPNLSDAGSRESEELLTEYGDIFAMNIDEYGWTDRVFQLIDTGETRPIRQPPRRLPLAKQANVGEMLEDMQRRGVIEKSDIPWSPPVVLVRKKNGA